MSAAAGTRRRFTALPPLNGGALWACDDWPFDPEQIERDSSFARRCGPVLVYRTAIPTEIVGIDQQPLSGGLLWSSLERVEGDLVVGITGTVERDGPLPELDPSAESYTFPADLLPDGVLPNGTTTVTC